MSSSSSEAEMVKQADSLQMGSVYLPELYMLMGSVTATLASRGVALN